MSGSRVMGSMYSWGPPSGTGVKRTPTRSFSLSFFPVAGQWVAMSGLSSTARASGVLLGTQKARIS